MSCPWIHRTDRSSYTTRLYICECPSCSRNPFIPTLGELRTHCLDENSYRKCPLYRKAGSFAAVATAETTIA